MSRVVSILILASLLTACDNKGADDTGASGPGVDDDTGTPYDGPVYTWDVLLGGAGEDYAMSVTPLPDGYLVGGSSTSGATSDYPDMWLARLDLEGQLQWSQTYGGGWSDYGESALAMDDGGFAIVGSGVSFSDSEDLYLVRTDAQGQELWSGTYGDTDFEDEVGDFTLTTSGDFIIVGQTLDLSLTYQALVMGVDSDGVELWSQTFGGDGHEYLNSVLPTDDGGALALGNTSSKGQGEHDMWLVKLSATGEVEWDKVFGGVNYDYGEDLVATSDGGYALVGTTYSNTTDIECDVWVVKVDATGEREWQAWWSEEGNEAANEYGMAITENADGDLIVVGATATQSEDNLDALVVTFAAQDGAVLDATIIDGDGADALYDIEPAVDGGVVFSGYSKSWTATAEDGWVIKADANGDFPEVP